ncbi:hypothetical protein GBF38_003921, partial [Xyrichtys novacula]
MRGGGGEQIREPCPVRAQSAGGNASGKPPYPCSDLEDAPAAAHSRHSGAERPRCIQTSCWLLGKLRTTAVENNTGVNR